MSNTFGFPTFGQQQQQQQQQPQQQHPAPVAGPPAIPGMPLATMPGYPVPTLPGIAQTGAVPAGYSMPTGPAAPSPAGFGAARGADLGAFITGTAAFGDRHGFLARGVHLLEVVKHERSTRKNSIGFTFRVVQSTVPEEIGRERFKTFAFGQDSGAGNGQAEVREQIWNGFVYKLLGLADQAAIDSALASGLHPGAVLNQCCQSPTLLAGRRVLCEVVPNSKGKTTKTGEVLNQENWAVAG